MTTGPDSIRFVYEADVLRIADVARSTRQNWVRLELLTDPPDGRYRERQVVEVVVISLLVRAVKGLQDVARLWQSAGDVVLAALFAAGAGAELALLVEPRSLFVTVARSDAEMRAAVRPFEPVVMVPVGRAVAEARAAFWRFAAMTKDQPDDRRRGSAQTARRRPPATG